MSRVAAAYERIRAGKDLVVCEGLGEIWQGRFLRTSGAEVVGAARPRDAARGQVRRRAPAGRHHLREGRPQAALPGRALQYGPRDRAWAWCATSTRSSSRRAASPATAHSSSEQPSLRCVGRRDRRGPRAAPTCAASSYGERLAETYMIGAMSPEHALRYFQLTPNKVVIVGRRPRRDHPRRARHAHRRRGAHRQLRAQPRRAERAPRSTASRSSLSSTDTVTAADDLRRLFGRLRVKERAKIDLIAGAHRRVRRPRSSGGRPARMSGDRPAPYVSPHEVTASWSAAAGERVVRVAVDAAGGDNAPDEVVRGALQAAGPLRAHRLRRRRSAAAAAAAGRRAVRLCGARPRCHRLRRGACVGGAQQDRIEHRRGAQAHA